MTKSNLSTNLNVEDLLKSLENTNTTKETILLYDIYPFLQKYNISYGNNYIPISLLYLLYTLDVDNLITEKQFQLELIQNIPNSTDLFHNIVYIHSNVSKEKVIQDIISLYKTIKINYNRKIIRRDELKPHFKEFVEKYNLKPGDLWFESRILYELYDRFAYRIGKKNPLEIRPFTTLCKEFFPYRKTSDCLVFAVDNSIMTYITPEQIDHLRQQKKQHGKRRKKKKKLSKEYKVSES